MSESTPARENEQQCGAAGFLQFTIPHTSPNPTFTEKLQNQTETAVYDPLIIIDVTAPKQEKTPLRNDTATAEKTIQTTISSQEQKLSAKNKRFCI
jgi:hypothetical protein